MPDVPASESSDAKPSDRRIATFSLSLMTERQLDILKKQLRLPSRAAVIAFMANTMVKQVKIDLGPAEHLALESHRHPGETLPELVWRALKDGGFFVVKPDEEVV